MRALTPEEKIEGFWARVDKTDPAGCWLWTAGDTGTGYGRYHFGGLAHRIAYQLLVGEIPADYEIDHLCKVRHCVNPAHLEAVTLLENRRRSAAKKPRTHCHRGHPYNDADTATNRQGYRCCRICRRNRERANTQAGQAS